jgi:lysophospholipase L1-like esterase
MRWFLLAAPLLLILSACGSGSPPEEGGLSGPGLYIALGDSLSEGVGATNRDSTAFVPLVHEGLGEGFDLMNLGHSGDTSSDLLDHGQLDETVAEVVGRNSDDDPNNDVKLVTLEIGGNDLLRLAPSLILTGTCTSAERALERPQCVDALWETLDEFGRNLGMALDRLREADPDLTIVVMTLYNPVPRRFGLFGSTGVSQMAEMALEGLPDTRFPEGLNDIVRGEGAERGAMLVDWHALFENKANEYIAQDFIHPNDAGHRVMAEAVLETVR